VLANELMTGYVNSGGSNPMSELTVRSLVDLGYTVNVGAADPFNLSLALRAGGDTQRPQLRLHNDIYTGPQYLLGRTGRLTRIRN
ncbi:MAG TPA: hypothetical protein VFZ20_01020, partial [Longimicrobium sp.]